MMSKVANLKSRSPGLKPGPYSRTALSLPGRKPKIPIAGTETHSSLVFRSPLRVVSRKPKIPIAGTETVRGYP